MHGHVAKGKDIDAIPVSDIQAVGSVSLAELRHFGVKSPALMARTPITRVDDEDKDNKKLRELVQRAWDKARMARADVYKQYLINLHNGTIIGAAPPVTLYVSSPGVSDGNGKVVFPYGAEVIAIDGETQIEARFRMRKEVPETEDIPFAVTIHHGITEDHAMQILHDYNRYAHPIAESKLGSRNLTGGIAQTIDHALALTTPLITKNQLNPTGMTGNKKQLVSYRQVMTFIAAVAVGKDALQKNATAWFDTLNEPGSPPINSNCANFLAQMINLSGVDKRLATAAPLIWQVAGVLCSEGRNPAQIKWDAGYNMYGATMPKTAGKQKISGRLQAVYDAMR